MLRVLQVVAVPAARKQGTVGVCGPERRTADAASWWASLGIEGIVCYPARGKLRNVFLDAGVKLIDFEIGTKFNLLAVLHLARIATQNGVHIIHTQGPASLDLLACLAARLARVPIVVTRPVMIEDQVNYSRLRRALYGLLDRLTTLRLADLVIAVSDVGYKHLRDYCRVPSSRLRRVHNGIDLTRFSVHVRPGNKGGFDTEPVVVGMVGQLIQLKGWPDFIEVIRRLRTFGLNVSGLIVGEGVMREQLERSVLSQSMQGYVTFTGHRDDIAEVYRSMDVFLFTTYCEGLSVAVIEALASGLPIVATNVAGIREQVLDGSNGYVVDVGDVDRMVIHCKALIESPEMRLQMGRMSRAIAQKSFAQQVMLQRYATCYRETAGRNERPAVPRANTGQQE